MDTSALRVVLNVTETNMIEKMRAEMDTLLESQKSLQRAYHLQQTLLRYATQFLDDGNIHTTGINPVTEMTMDELEATLEAIANCYADKEIPGEKFADYHHTTL